MATVVPDPRSIRAFPSEEAFAAWLAANHDKRSELYLRIYKKGSGKATVSNTEAGRSPPNRLGCESEPACRSGAVLPALQLSA